MQYNSHASSQIYKVQNGPSLQDIVVEQRLRSGNELEWFTIYGDVEYRGPTLLELFRKFEQGCIVSCETKVPVQWKKQPVFALLTQYLEPVKDDDLRLDNPNTDVEKAKERNQYPIVWQSFRLEMESNIYLINNEWGELFSDAFGDLRDLVQKDDPSFRFRTCIDCRHGYSLYFVSRHMNCFRDYPEKLKTLRENHRRAESLLRQDWGDRYVDAFHTCAAFR